MSLEATKNQLIQLLQDSDYKVIALSGKWGTGKSYMWRDIKKNSSDEGIKNALYVSLFGLNSMDSVKLRIIQSSIPGTEKNPALRERVRASLEPAKKILESFDKRFSAIGDLALLAVPAILKGRLIVLDDLERKHDKLDIDQVLGFIDEFTQQHESRFIIILNSDQLKQKEIWSMLHEKVIDQEIRLNTSCKESLQIASDLSPSFYSKYILHPVEICGITNIRIIRKIIKTVNRILGGHDNLTDAVMSRVIPSIVLFSAIHYKGIDDGPPIDFALEHGSIGGWIFKAKKEDLETDDGKRKLRWQTMITDLGIHSCDEFELILVEFLQSGMFDPSAVSAIIERYAREQDVMTTRQDCGNFFESRYWDYRKSEEEFEAEAKSISERAHLLDAYWITSFCNEASKLQGGKKISDEALENWLMNFRNKNHDEVNDENPFHREIHPRIVAEFDAINEKAQSRTTAYDACIYAKKNSSWGPRQELAMKAASPQDFEEIIRTRSPIELKPFIRGMLDFCLHKETYERHFGFAMDNFIEACGAIVESDNPPRLAALVQDVFATAGLGHTLERHPKTGTSTTKTSPTADRAVP